jgi:ATP adenylyltransferase
MIPRFEVQTMKRLWAPWRMKFVESQDSEDNCVFCLVLSQKRDKKNLVIFRGQAAYVILNRYPYTSGHLMVVANAHLPSLEVLDVQVRSEMIELAT